jgi:hypothetical protein
MIPVATSRVYNFSLSNAKPPKMYKKITPTAVLASLCLCLALLPAFRERWGFFGHRRINRLAVFTLPVAMVPFYKKNIEYLTEHAVDPDKRRYATKHEAVRHYIDLDRYPEPLPMRWEEAFAEYTELYAISPAGDTILVFSRHALQKTGNTWHQKPGGRTIPYFPTDKGISATAHLDWVKKHLLSQYYEEDWSIPCDTLRALYGQGIPCGTVIAADSLTLHGILPYHLLQMHRRLTRAFQAGDAALILQLSSEIGHYIADAHVPLHTTMNYNGQLTGQTGIHAFWESRIPELFADKHYDFFVGQSKYLNEPAAFYWNIVLQSHQLVDSVLRMERAVRQEFPGDLQFCPNEKPGGIQRVPCPAYAEAYQNKLNGMVEHRMRAAILAVGSAWYSAWADAGQPDLRRLPSNIRSRTAEEGIQQSSTLQIRPHQ